MNGRVVLNTTLFNKILEYFYIKKLFCVVSEVIRQHQSRSSPSGCSIEGLDRTLFQFREFPCGVLKLRVGDMQQESLAASTWRRATTAVFRAIWRTAHVRITNDSRFPPSAKSFVRYLDNER